VPFEGILQGKKMLQWMRDAQTWFIKGVLGAVVLAFVLTIFYQWGVRSGGGLARSEVATIFGQPVNVREFQRMYNALQQRYRAIFRTQSEVDLSERFNFREMALEQLATRAILLRLAQQYGVVVTEQELYDHIAGMTPFQEQGQFSPTRYQLVLRSQVPPIAPRQFEAEQQQDLLLQKVSALFTEGVHVTDAEIEQAYRREHEQAAVRYVALPASLFEAQVTMTDEELQAYYEANK
jgi:peptidyl-prolyl cis-trans isomerase D